MGNTGGKKKMGIQEKMKMRFPGKLELLLVLEKKCM